MSAWLIPRYGGPRRLIAAFRGREFPFSKRISPILTFPPGRTTVPLLSRALCRREVSARRVYNPYMARAVMIGFVSAIGHFSPSLFLPRSPSAIILRKYYRETRSDGRTRRLDTLVVESVLERRFAESSRDPGYQLMSLFRVSSRRPTR